MPVVAQAQSPAVQFRVPAGPLQTALPLFATQSGEQILYSTDLVAGRQSAGVSGALRTDQALTTLLQGTGLRARRTSPNTLVVYDPDARADATDEAVEIEDVVVTGSLIRGVADGPSPVVTVTRDEMDRNGRATVAQLLASLPQNFGGTANEGALGNGGDRSGTNSTYANGVNLRGLGSDATLVLINGRRLAGTGAKGDFVDVSTIPTAAVERVDILLDGASALYGPDVTEDILTNCGIEVVFAPKELKVAQELSERLGYYTYQALSRSRPMGLGSGRRNTTTSDQRRALMMPQELMQLPERSLIVLKAGMPPARGEKIRFFRERVFTRRQRPAPIPPRRPVAPELASASPVTPAPALEETDMSYESVVQAFTEQGCPPPEIGASENEVADWLDQIIDAIVPAPDRDDDR
ncbi:type IV secretory system conjugative DNA transfer family protein [Brevundimonas sp.]|uniref:type IV secretory system conjugative DNA transfer family protein n=1 Tax=Brevundimonas sp. TaxID=1871086 RepID=UPI0028AA772E|nr:type IV secretory system conjugative DNA transfer family protein [Brevundimonas sp.]